MIDKIKVNLSTDHIWECSTDIIGREGEGNTTRFEITVPEKLVGWSVYLDFTKPNGEKLRTPKLKIENGVVYYDVVPYLLTDDGELKAQAVIISASNQTWKSSNKTYHIQDSIDALEEIPEKEDFMSEAQKILDAVQDALRSLGANVFGVVDQNNHIILTGDVEYGEYKFVYEDNYGNRTEIGTQIIGGSNGDDSGGDDSGESMPDFGSVELVWSNGVKLDKDTGVEGSGEGYSASQFIDIASGYAYTMHKLDNGYGTTYGGINICYYDANDKFLGYELVCEAEEQSPVSKVLTLPQNATKFRIRLYCGTTYSTGDFKVTFEKTT